MNMSDANVDQRREAIRAALRESPGISDRQLGKRLGVHHVTIGTQRKAMENAGELQRAAATLGPDGKSYSKDRRKAGKAKASKPVSLGRLVSTAMSNLMRRAEKEHRMPELAQAFQSYVERLGTKNKGTGAVLPAVLKKDIEPALPSVPEPALPDLRTRHAGGVSNDRVDFDTPEVPAAEERKRRAAEANAAARHFQAQTLRDVRRDILVAPAALGDNDQKNVIIPDADNDDYGDLPTEEQVALSEVEAPKTLPEPPPLLGQEPGHWWEKATVMSFFPATQCGVVGLATGGNLQIVHTTLREDGLVLEKGAEVDVRLVMVRRDGREFLRVTGLGHPELA
jgi:hypothetical protein